MPVRGEMDEGLRDFRALTARVAAKLGRIADELQRDAELRRFRTWCDSLPGPDHVAEFPLAPLKRAATHLSEEAAA